MNPYGLAWTVIVAIFALVVAIFIYLRRHLYPLSERLPFFSILAVLTMVALLFDLLLIRDIIAGTPCALTWGIATVLMGVLFCTYSLRAWSLIFRSEISANLNEMKQLKGNALPASEFGWYLKNRRFVSNSFLVKILAGYTGVLLIIVLICIPFNHVLRDGLECSAGWGDGRKAYMVLILVQIILHTAFYVWVSVKIHPQVPDAYGIRREFKRTAVLVSTFIILYGLLDRKLTASQFTDAQLFVNAVILLFWLSAMGVVPVYGSYGKPMEPKDDISLDIILKNAVWCQIFLDFLKTEFSTENLLFWQAVEGYKQSSMSREERVVLMHEILSTYVVQNAPCEVNLPWQIKQDLIKKASEIERSADLCDRQQSGLSINQSEENVELELVSLQSASSDVVSIASTERKVEPSQKEDNEEKLQTIFNFAQREVRRLMEDDSYPRFRLSAGYKDVQEQKKEQEKHSTTRPSVVIDLDDHEIANELSMMARPSAIPLATPRKEKQDEERQLSMMARPSAIPLATPRNEKQDEEKQVEPQSPQEQA